MEKTDAMFLCCVLAFAGLLAGRSVLEAVPAISRRAESGSAPLGAAGQPRNVDMTELRHQLEQGILSDHEAEFYEPIGTTTQPTADQEHNGP